MLLIAAALTALVPLRNQGLDVVAISAIELGALALALIGVAALRFGLRAKRLGIDDKQLTDDLNSRWRAKFR